MSLASINPTETRSWKSLDEHFQAIRNEKMQDMFTEDPGRAEQMSVEWKDLRLDYSKNRLTQETISLLTNLADEVKLGDAISKLFKGDPINKTERRPVWHTELRNFSKMNAEVRALHQKMKEFSNAIIDESWKGYTGRPITDIVNVGIGGSDLGPKMVTEALRFYKNHLKVHYVSNVDGDQVAETLNGLDRETTLFIIVSKSFTTQETLTNANTIRNWFLSEADETSIKHHFIGVSTNRSEVLEFGISEKNIFPMWDWVGGRFSLWSAVGLSVCCSIGFDRFLELLRGAHEMDLHFRETEFHENIPVIMALISIWYNNFFRFESEAVIPYTHYLESLIPYLQQAVMESNGKSVDRSGHKIDYQTGNIIWGSTGTNAQHAFFQLLHQGTKIIPADFIGFSNSLHGNREQHSILMANFMAQTQALLQGTYGEEISDPYKRFEGNRPTNTILIQKLTPSSLGSLIALYEHKLFVQGVVWNIFSYDQWGVQLGKSIARDILDQG
jgi:glucose-6-phosphate isomerase